MKKSVQRKKIARRASTRIIRRAEVPTYKDIVKKMSNTEDNRRKIYEDLYIHRNDQNNERIQINLNVLINKFGMSKSDIEKEYGKVVDEHNLHKDLRRYYSSGSIKSEDLINKWKHKGLETESDVNIAAMRIMPWESPINYDDKTKRLVPSGKMQATNLVNRENRYYSQMNIVTNSALFKKYKSEISNPADEAVRKGKISPQEALAYKQEGLMDIVDRRPEYAAVIYFILKGGNPHARDIDMKTIVSQFRKGSPEFVYKMNNFRLQRSRGNLSDPDYQKKRIEELERISKMKNQSFDPSKRSETNPYRLPVGAEFIKVEKEKLKALKNRVKLDSDAYSLQVDPYTEDLYGHGVEDRRKKRAKITPKRKIIKKKIVKKCRCK